MPVAAAAGVALLLAGVLVGFVVVVTYNTVVALRRRVERALANVEVALKQRHDELPNLVAAVQGQLGFEVLALQEEIERLENLIAHRRELYNEQAYQHNATIRQLPAVLLAGIFGWQPVPFFDAEPQERTRPEAQILGA
jgi:hypothetical protein